MTDESDFPSQIDENRNKNSIYCQYCDSLMLKPKTASYMEDEFSLPLMHQKKKPTQSQPQPQEMETENLKHFWRVKDMFTFENIGFSNTVETAKYLICADCEMGPVGYQLIGSKECFVALKRVKHV
ncbi:hypothetical protein HA402_014770 [Bradysia odoriphaga]|nr:hypothetical protein HA402_014770 [Bradysia odoriphaga]